MYETSTTPGKKVARAIPTEPATDVSVLLVGSHRIVRTGLQKLLESSRIAVAASLSGDQELQEAIASDNHRASAVVQILCGAEPFATFHRIENVLASAGKSLPLVILAEQSTRGHVYGAIRAGAKAYVDLDADPIELVKAITTAAAGKVYLAGDAAELLVNDVSGAVENGRSGRLPDPSLSKREIEIVQLMCEGLSSKEIGRALHISPKTVENHRYNIYRKCGIESLASLVRYAIQTGLTTI